MTTEGEGKIEEHAAIVIRNKENEILFIKRSMKKKTLPGAWSFPSGKIEEGERTYETAIREAKEELNVEVEPEKIFAQKELPEFSANLVFVLCDIKSGEPEIKEPNEIQEVEWLTFNDFFKKFSDNEIGHGLIWLRKNPKIWEDIK